MGVSGGGGEWRLSSRGKPRYLLPSGQPAIVICLGPWADSRPALAALDGGGVHELVLSCLSTDSPDSDTAGGPFRSCMCLPEELREKS